MATQGLFDGVFEELLNITEGGFGDFIENTQHDTNKRLLRKLNENYDKMTLSEVTELWDVLGHRSDEKIACPTCKVIAKNEFRLAEE